jgi:lysozyme
MPNFTTSAAMRQMIEAWEGCVLTAYTDAVGVLTIGYGHTGSDVHPGQTVTQVEADTLLANDLHKFEIAVNALVGDATTQNQFDAMVSFAFNLGARALAGSTLLREHKAGDYPAAGAEFPKWDRAGGQELAGLLRRRQGEEAVYLNAEYT